MLIALKYDKEPQYNACIIIIYLENETRQSDMIVHSMYFTKQVKIICFKYHKKHKISNCSGYIFKMYGIITAILHNNIIIDKKNSIINERTS